MVLTSLPGGICMAARCRRLTSREVCWLHTFVPQRRDFDPCSTVLSKSYWDEDEFHQWWQASQPYVRKLTSICDDHRFPEKSQRKRVAGYELSQVYRQAVYLTAERLAQTWRRETDSPEWRLPPDGWIYQRACIDYPQCQWDRIQPSLKGFPSDATPQQAQPLFDFCARSNQARKHPSRPPFRPLTEERVIDQRVEQGLREQQSRNLRLLDDHHEAIFAHKQHADSSRMSEVFADSELDTSIPEATVVYHQIDRDNERYGLSKPNHFGWAFNQHINLAVGDVIRYDHFVSTTIKLWWFYGDGSAIPHWLNQDGEETAIRLEMAPKRGLFLDDQARHLMPSQVSNEDELVLPAGTYWEVVGIIDAIQSDARGESEGPTERLRAIQMVEIEADEVGDRHLHLLTRSDALSGQEADL